MTEEREKLGTCDRKGNWLFPLHQEPHKELGNCDNWREQPAQAVPPSQSPDYEICTNQNWHPEHCDCKRIEVEGISAEQLTFQQISCPRCYHCFAAEIKGRVEPKATCMRQNHMHTPEAGCWESRLLSARMQERMSELGAELGELRKERDALIRTCQKTESALAECRWIPVSEKLPGESVGVVLIRIDEERMKKWAGEPSAGGDYKFYEDNFSAEVDMWNTVAVRHWAQNADWLTHWRPLPNPPVKGERQEPVDREEK